MESFRDLTPLFRPRGIAVVGATPRGNRGLEVLRNLRRFGFEGATYAVNPKHDEIDGFPCVPTLGQLGAGTDLVVVAVAAERVVDVVDDAGMAGIPAAVVIASGFGDGGLGERRRDDLRSVLEMHGMVAVGPNCYGLLDVHQKVAAYSGSIVDPLEPGGVALILQSGALTHAVTDSAVDRGLGLSAIVTTGNELSASLADYVAWFANDPCSTVLGIFLEGLRDPVAFAAAARRARTAGKPVVVLATGRSGRGRSAALAHTGAVAGSGSALSGLLRSVGAIQVHDLDEFRETLLLLSSVPAPRAPGAAVVSISGGGTGLMADLAEEMGLSLPELSDDVRVGVQGVLPDFGVAANPLDATGAAAEDPAILPALMGQLARNPSVGAVCFAFNVGHGSLGQEGFYRQQGHLLAAFARTCETPTVAFSMTSGQVDQEIRRTLANANVPLLSGMRPSLTAIGSWLRWYQQDVNDAPPTPAARPLPGHREVVSGYDALAELETMGITIPPYEVVASPEEAAEAAVRVGFPCVLKIESPEILHKTEVGGVQTNLRSPEEVQRAAEAMWEKTRSAAPHAEINGFLVQGMVSGPTLECLLGVVRDPQVGLVLSVAPGGVLVELLGEAASMPVPVGAAQAESMLEGSALSRLLAGYRGAPPLDRQALVDAIVAFSDLAAAYGSGLAAAEINPLLVRARGKGVAAVDCLIIKEKK
jgi:acetyltransferase